MSISTELTRMAQNVGAINADTNAYNRYYYDGATFGSSKDEKWKAFSIRLVKDVS